MKNKEINKVFKQVLKTFVAEMLNPCESFVGDIDKCDTYDDLKELFEENAKYIFDSLGGECEECEAKDDEIDEKSNEIYELTSSVCGLKNENDDMESDLKNAYIPVSLDDEYKLEAFKIAKDKFSVSEIESLLD